MPRSSGAIDINLLINFLKQRYPDSKCALIFHNDYQLLVSIILSAQTTDKAVNKVTPALYAKYPDFHALGLATPEEIAPYIKSLGLYKNKSFNLSNLGKIVDTKPLPLDFNELVKLPGVGRKTAGVFLLEKGIASIFPVDTHIKRISNRLKLSTSSDVNKISQRLSKIIPKLEWFFLHHALITFGRDLCSAQKPKCEACSLKEHCHFYLKKTSSTTFK